MKHKDPFYAGTYNKVDCFTITAQDRIEKVKEFDLDQCLRALQVGGLQLTVRKAIERRIRGLEGPA